MTTRTGVRAPLLLTRLLDDAAIFPPGNTPMAEALTQHAMHEGAWYAGIVGRFVCTTQRLPDLVAALPGDVATPLDLTLVVPSGVRAVGPAVAEVSQESRIALRAVDVPASAGDLAATLHALDALSLDVPTYLELPLSCDLRPLQGSRHRVKFRTGGVTVGAVPSSGLLAIALHEVVAKGVPFKLTAGLHHAVAAADRHGFANILVAVHAALDGRPVEDLAGILALHDGELLTALLRALTADECRRVRQLFVSFGTCSIAEPLADLVSLGLLAPELR